jgi:hypothetical protein
MHLIYRNPRTLVIENRGTFFNARGGMSLDELESCAATGDIELDLAPWRDAQGFSDPLRNGDLTLAMVLPRVPTIQSSDGLIIRRSLRISSWRKTKTTPMLAPFRSNCATFSLQF